MLSETGAERTSHLGEVTCVRAQRALIGGLKVIRRLVQVKTVTYLLHTTVVSTEAVFLRQVKHTDSYKGFDHVTSVLTRVNKSRVVS